MQTDDQGDAGPVSTDDLNDPEFRAYLSGLGQLPVRPDREDFGPPKRGALESAARYRQAQARKMIRLYRRWRSGPN
jgi:hypothetical protein